ncbi:hypothetical protein N7488_007944 [Penicillium malachiteum]|nr:hypothetical protein N7488_007944 [Penicillium malachiteum]
MVLLFERFKVALIGSAAKHTSKANLKDLAAALEWTVFGYFGRNGLPFSGLSYAKVASSLPSSSNSPEKGPQKGSNT